MRVIHTWRNEVEHGQILGKDALHRNELLATPISAIHPAETAELEALLDRVHRNGRASTIALTCRTKQGVFLPTEITLHALELDGRTRVLGLVHDRSEHRQATPPVGA